MISKAVNLHKFTISNYPSLKILKPFLNLFVTQIFYHKNGKQGFEGDLKANGLFKDMTPSGSNAWAGD